MAIYNTKIRQQKVDKGEPVDNDVSTSSFGEDFKNKFAARLRDTNQDPNKKSFGSFGNEERDNFITNKMPAIDGNPEFNKEQDQARASDFLNKYLATNLVPTEEKATAESTLGYMQGDPNSNLRGKFPGSEGVATT